MKFDINKLENWQKIGVACLLVVIPGLIGWLVEFFFAWYDNGMIDVYFKGGNFLPWINIYSVGAFLMLTCTYRFRDKPLHVFLISIISGGILELLTGMILYRCFGIRYWDYTNEILNFNGYICLLSLSCFGLGGVFLMYFLIPGLIKLSTKIPKKVFLTISITLCTLVLVDEIYNFFITKIFDLPTSTDIYTKHGIKYTGFE